MILFSNNLHAQLIFMHRSPAWGFLWGWEDISSPPSSFWTLPSSPCWFSVAALHSLLGPSVWRQFRQVVIIVPGQDGWFWSMVPWQSRQISRAGTYWQGSPSASGGQLFRPAVVHRRQLPSPSSSSGPLLQTRCGLHTPPRFILTYS